MTKMKSENTKLKSKVFKSEKELLKKNKEVKRLLEQLNAPSAGLYNISRQLMPKKSSKSVSQLVMGLKKKISIIQKENKTLKEGLDALKKSLKMTTTQELDAEISTYSKECTRLRIVLEQLTQEKIYANSESDEKIINTFKEQEDTLGKLQAESKTISEKLAKTTKEIEKLKGTKSNSGSPDSSNQDLMMEQMREIQKLKDQIEAMKKATKSKSQVDELNKEKAAYLKKSNDNEQIIRDLGMELVQHKRAKETELKELKKNMEGDAGENEEKKILDVVDKEALRSIVTELRLNIILSHIERKDLQKILFKNYKDSELISIHELSKTLRRTPGSLNSDSAIKLARYIIEPNKEKKIEYDEFREAKFSTVNKELLNLIGDFTSDHNDHPEKLQESILEKICEKLEEFSDMLHDSADHNGNLTLESVEKICKKLNLNLNQNEMDYIILTMYKSSKNIKKLNYEKLLEHLGELVKKVMSGNIDSNSEPDFPGIKNEEKSSPEDFKDLGSSDTKKQNASDEKNLAEEEILQMMQKCLSKVAEAMTNKGLTVDSLFKNDIYKKKIDGEQVNLISPENFMKAVKNLGVPAFSSIEATYLKKMLSASDNEEGFKVNDLAQILEEYAGTDSNPDMKDVKLDDLDKVSLVLLLALSEYLSKEKCSINDVFGESIYKQPIQIDDEELDIEIINSGDFFKKINDIGIETEESQHDNLKAFLCIDAEYSDMFSIDKLKTVLEQFKTNKELRDKARKYYQELVDEDQLQEEGNIDDLNPDE